MLRSNPPPLIHGRSVLDSKIGNANTEQEDAPLNLTCRRPPSSNDCCSEECAMDGEMQYPSRIYAPIAKWGVAYHPVLNLASEEYARYCYAQQQIRVNLEKHVMTGSLTSDCNISVGWNLPYYSPYWHIFNAIMKQQLEVNPFECEPRNPEVRSIGNGYCQPLSPQKSGQLPVEETNKFESYRAICHDVEDIDVVDDVADGNKSYSKGVRHEDLPMQLASTGRGERKREQCEDKLENAKARSRQTEQSYDCKQCGARYTHRFELNRHIKVSHIRPHRCGHCGKGFGHKNYLRVHIETVHMGRKTHKCEECGKYLSTGGNLSVHVRTIHMGEKKYRCPVCSRTFGQQCNMKTHMRRHYVNGSDKE